MPLNYVVWLYDTVMTIGYAGTTTGSASVAGEPATIGVRGLGSVLKEVAEAEGGIDLVKMTVRSASACCFTPQATT